MLAVVSQLDPRVDTPGPEDLYAGGNAGHPAQGHPRAQGQPAAVLRRRRRASAPAEFTATRAFSEGAQWSGLPDVEPEMTAEMEALRQNVLRLFQQIVAALAEPFRRPVHAGRQIAEPGRLADFITGTLPGLSHPERQKLLEEIGCRSQRLREMHRHLTREVELLELRGKIQSAGEGAALAEPARILSARAVEGHPEGIGGGRRGPARRGGTAPASWKPAGMPEEVKTEAMKELNRLSRISPMSPEYSVTRTYLEWMAALPWSISSGSQVDVRNAPRRSWTRTTTTWRRSRTGSLDYLAVLQLRPVLKGPILCFVGPPGVGKTSLGRSIARAVGRKFARISMGGMHDEAEIRGPSPHLHRALCPARSSRRCGAPEPTTRSSCWTKSTSWAAISAETPRRRCWRCSTPSRTPRSATTTWTCRSICPGSCSSPRPTCSIRSGRPARPHGDHSPARVHRAGKGDHRVPLPDSAADEGKRARSREATSCLPTRPCVSWCGVTRAKPACATWSGRSARSAANRLGALRKGRRKRPRLPRSWWKACWAPRAFAPTWRSASAHAAREWRWGWRGRRWAATCCSSKPAACPGGNKGLIMTGQLGPVMQESVQAALTWVRANATALRIDPDMFKTSDIHIHVPAGAIPKDGPSAGITMASALLSMLTDRCIRPNLAMTGEITLTGQVLPDRRSEREGPGRQAQRCHGSHPPLRK